MCIYLLKFLLFSILFLTIYFCLLCFLFDFQSISNFLLTIIRVGVLLGQTDDNYDSLSCLLTWERENVTPNSFFIKLVEIAGNGKDWSASTDILTGFNDLVRYINIAICFSFRQILRGLLEYCNIELRYFKYPKAFESHKRLGLLNKKRLYFAQVLRWALRSFLCQNDLT